ncbi:MAG: glycosyltransferase [Phycisphaerae bacterium]
MLSVCVALKNRSRVLADGRELRLFPTLVESLARTAPPNTELVVADWDSDDWPLAEWLPDAVGPVALRVVRMAGRFTRGGGRNAAAAAARGDTLFFTDADCLLSPAVFERGAALLREGKAFFPVLYSLLDPDHRTGFWHHWGYGNALMTRAVFDQVGGWPDYKKWGREDVHFFERVSALVPTVREEVPGFFHQWHPDDVLWKDPYGERTPEEEREIRESRVAMRELAALIPAGQSFVLVDEARFGVSEVDGRPARPFLERDGEYAGPPPDDDTAIRELQRMRAEGARFIAFAWMAFWWLDHYAGLHDYLRQSFPCVLRNERLAVFALDGAAIDSPAGGRSEQE